MSGSALKKFILQIRKQFHRIWIVIKPKTIQWASKTTSAKSVQPKEAHLHQSMDMKMIPKDLDILLLYSINSSAIRIHQ